jgi:chitin synthase
VFILSNIQTKSILCFQAKIQADLKELRNKSVFFFSVFNALFVLIVFMLTLHKDTLHIDWPFGIKENITITEDEQVCARDKTFFTTLRISPAGFDLTDHAARAR